MMQFEPDSVNPDQIVKYVDDRAWIPLGALVVGIVVRLLKDDTILPTIPAKWRLVAVLVLSFGLVILNKVAAGMPWVKAVEYASISAIIAIATHEMVIERLRGGKEIPVPLLTKKGPELLDLEKEKEPANGSPPTTPPS